MEYIKKTLDTFFDNEESNVLVLKGDWGVGKTHFWNNYISEKIDNNSLSQIAYSYISLFGNNTLQEVRKSVFRQAKPISVKEVDKTIEIGFETDNTMFGRMVQKGIDYATKKAPNTNDVTKFVEYLPIANKYANAINILEYNLVNNYVVCIDDIERKGDSLTIKEIMGWIDELSEQKSCKVILIFNENSFDCDKDKIAFEAYREKVVDYEVTYSPTYKQNLGYVFDDDFKYFNQLRAVSAKLNLKNVRIFKKIKWAYDYFEPYWEDIEETEVKKFILNLIVHCKFYFEKDEELSYDSFIDLAENFSFINDQIFIENALATDNSKKKELSPAQKKYKNLVEKLNFSTSDFGFFISYFLKNGYLNEEEFTNFLTEYHANEKARLVGEELESIWAEKYSGSFDDNFSEFSVSLIEFISEHIELIDLNDFSSAINILYLFDINVDKLICSYVKTHRSNLLNISLRRISHPFLKEKIESIQPDKTLNIDDVALSIFEKNGWDEDILIYLDSLSEEDYYNWMKSNPNQMVKKIRGGLLTFSPSDDPTKYASIGRKVHNTLRRIASENNFNAYRIECLYDITVEN